MNVRNNIGNIANDLVYSAKSKATGASCLIRIVDMDGTKVVNDATMTEVDSTNSPGDYKYTWTPSTSGAYLVFMFETIFTSPVKLETELIEVRSW